jgi:citrate lyase synthetase
MAEKYGDKAGLTDDFEMIEVKRSDDDISATKVRQALLDNDKRTFDKLTPFGTLTQHLRGNESIYEILKNQINKVINK